MATPTQTHVPAPDDATGLHMAAVEHLFVGTRNAAQLAEEGGPLMLVGSDGIYVDDMEGNRYIDGIGGMYFRNVGHGREEIARAVYEQLKDVSMHVYAGSTPSTVRLAAKLAELTPGDLTKTFFTSGGSESNETSLKLAQGYHNRTGERGRYKVISRKGSYHGATWATMWLGSHPFLPREEYQPVPSHVVHVANPNPYRCEYGGQTPEECAELCANAIEEAILFHSPESVSAVIAEPVSQPLGGVVPGPGYFERVREICDRYGVLLIFDEVITGFGRTGKWFGADTVGVTPDIMSIAKGLTSGYFPMGGTIASKRVSDAFTGGPDATFKHMFTYTGHPAGCAAALANLEIIEREGLVENCRIQGERLSERLLEIKDRHPIVGDVRGIGLLQGLELVKDRKTKEHWPASAEIGPKITQGLMDR
ncbi:MAG: aspartate aminotransferase family protein, partial [Chloroflexi bacterium]|nr:aspartate aminotransferase family protein [Chloroflexota bacterium]